MADEDEAGPEEDAETEGVDNVATKKGIRTKRVRAQTREERIREEYRGLLSRPSGRMLLWDILESLGAFGQRMQLTPTGFPSTEATLMKLGEERAGFRLYLSWIPYAPDQVQLMLQENETQLAESLNPRRRRTAAERE